MIGQAPPAGFPALTLAFCGSGLVVLVAIVARRAWRARRGGPQVPGPRYQPFGAYDPLVLVGVALLAFSVYGLGLESMKPDRPLVTAAVAGAAAVAIAAGLWYVLLRPAFRPAGSAAGRFGRGLLAGWAALPAIYGAAWVVQAFGGPSPQIQVTQLENREQGWPNVALQAVLLAPVMEELIFRGLLYPAARRVWGPRAALVSSAVLFALVHWSAPVVWAPMAIFGVVLATLVETSGSLLPSIAAHAAFNALTVVQLLVE